MSTKFQLTRDINGYNGFGLKFADDKYSTTLASSVAQSLVIPSNFAKWIAIFSFAPGTEVWVANNAAATIPGGAFAATNSELNPVGREVAGGDILSFITPNTQAEVSVTLYALQ